MLPKSRPIPARKSNETWPAVVEYRMQNREETGLGKPLPAARYR